VERSSRRLTATTPLPATHHTAPPTTPHHRHCRVSIDDWPLVDHPSIGGFLRGWGGGGSPVSRVSGEEVGYSFCILHNIYIIEKSLYKPITRANVSI